MEAETCWSEAEIPSEAKRQRGTLNTETLVIVIWNFYSSNTPDSFRKIIKEGDAERLAGMMVANGDLYSGSLELLADPDWSGSLVMPA